MTRSNSYLDPRRSIGVAPAADNQIEHIGPCCLDVNSKSAYLMKGRGAGVWLMIWMAMMMSSGVLLVLLVDILVDLNFTKHALLNVVFILSTVAVPSLVVFGLSLLWPIHVWRTHLPMRFNRKTRKVYFHHRGKTYVSDWDTIRAYLKVQGGVTPQGVPIADPHVNIEFDDGKGGIITVFLMGTAKIVGKTPYEKAAELWEYIRLYMEEGPENLPSRVPHLPELVAGEILKQDSPFPIFTSKSLLAKLLFDLPFFFINVVLFFIHYPTDLLYYQLSKRIKRKPYPPEMVEACACEETEAAEATNQAAAKEVMA